MKKNTRITEIKNFLEEFDNYNLALIDDYLLKLRKAPQDAKNHLLKEIVSFLNRINVNHRIDKNLNIIVER